MISTYLLCRRCRLLHPLERDDVASSDPDQMAVQFDLDLFRVEHAAHDIEVATRRTISSVGDRPAWDPMAMTWFQVATGHDELLVRAWRPSIELPRRFEVEVTAPPDVRSLVEIDTPLLFRALDRHFFPHALRPRKVEAFAALVHDLIGRLDPEAVETSFDDAAYPNAAIAPFPAHLCETLLVQCTTIFDASELERVAHFIEANRREDGCLALRVHRRLAA